MSLSFVDSVLARAGTDFVGSGLLSETGLRNLITASYDLAGQILQGPFTYAGDDLSFGGFGFDPTEMRSTPGQSTESALSLAIAAADPARIDLLWRGTVRAGGGFPLATVDVETIAPLNLSTIDAAIPGGAPTNAAALESARRAVLLGRLQAAANDPTAFDADSIIRLLAEGQVGSVAELLAVDGGSVRFSQLVLSLTPIPGSTTVRMRDFPIAAAILVRDIATAADPLATMLHASQVVLERLRHAGFEARGTPDLPPPRPVIVWIVRQAWFDEAEWPGTGGNAAAQRASRINNASAWLARQGIALNPTA